jgi:hypothetical protein
MRIVRTIPTPWPPYTVMFSQDGSRLAIGGGTWYGDGGILLVDLVSGAAELSTCAELLLPTRAGHDGGHQPPPSFAPTVSGVCFSNDDRHLAASMWTSRQHYAPSVLCDVDGLKLSNATPVEVANPERFSDGLDTCPTGVLLFGSVLITRNHGGNPNDVIMVAPLPADRHVAAERPVQRFTHSRVIVARQAVITESGGSRGLSIRQDDGSYLRRVIPEGLVFRPLDGLSADVIVPVPDCDRVTAIASLNTDETFLSGGINGQIDLWTWHGDWVRQRVQDSQPPKTVKWPEIGRLSWDFYSPISIVGLVAISRADTWASVTAGGDLTIRTAVRPEPAWQLPVAGTPRSIAAHPQNPWVAVGVKQGSFDRPESVVAIVEVA